MLLKDRELKRGGDTSGIETIADWDCFIESEITRNRVGECRIRLNGPKGKPIPSAKLEVIQRENAFTFGVCPNGHISIANQTACGDGAESDAYWKDIGDLFNATTLWWGWRVLEPRPGVWAFEKAEEGTHVIREEDPETGKPFWTELPREYGPWDGMINRAKALGHRLTGHALLYPRGDVSPAWIHQFSEKGIKEQLERTVRETVRRHKDIVSVWHPVNENFSGDQKIGPLEINEAEVYRWVREEAPESELVNNGGYEIDPEFYEQSLRKADTIGVHIDTLGVRGYHELYLSEDVFGMKRRWNHFNHLVERYGRWLRYTEIGANSRVTRTGVHDPSVFLSGSAMNEGIVTVEGEIPELTEQTQADFLVRMYKAIYAHPAMLECSYWDLMDVFTWNKVEGGLIDSHNRRKLAYHQLQKLIQEEWGSSQSVITDDLGQIQLNLHHGEYDVLYNRQAIGTLSIGPECATVVEFQVNPELPILTH